MVPIGGMNLPYSLMRVNSTGGCNSLPFASWPTAGTKLAPVCNRPRQASFLREASQDLPL